MASDSKSRGGLIIVGSVLAVVAITLYASRSDQSSGPQDASDTAPGAIQGGENMTNVASSHGSLDHANDNDFQQKVLNANGRVLVDFYADWCGPCRMIAPLLEDLAREEPSVHIVKVNVDDSPEVAKRYGIEAIPALIAFENGQQVDDHVGVASKDKLRSLLGL